jgi:hypothetical protein
MGQPLNTASIQPARSPENPYDHSAVLMPVVHHTETPMENTGNKALKAAGHIAAAVGFFMTARLLHRLPAYHPTFPPSFQTRYKKWQLALAEMIPMDWKDWARIGLGVGMVKSINKVIDTEPPPWVNALETVAVLTPMMGAKVFSKKTWRYFPMLAIGVPLLVQGTDWGKQALAKNEKIPKWIPNTVLPIASTIVGMVAFRKGIKAMESRTAGSQGSGGTNQVIGSEVSVICARCGGMHLVCPSEIGEMMGAFVATGHQQNKSNVQASTPLNTQQIH